MTFIGGAIRSRRQYARLTIGQLAARAGMSRPYLNNVERGHQIPSTDMLSKIANVFPDADATWWAWLLLRDLWGDELAEQMCRHAIATYMGDD